MSNVKDLETYRVIWLFGSVLVIVSFFLSYAYDRTLILTMQSYLPRMFDFLNNPSLENITTTVVDIDFILLMFGAAYSLIFSLLAINRRGARIESRFKLWNASTLELTGLVLFSSPIFLYENGKLIQILSFLGTEYFPKFDGFGAGYYLTWFGVITSIIASRKVTRIIRLIELDKNQNQG